MIKKKEVPGYLKIRCGECGWQRVANYMLGNEIREGRYRKVKRKKDVGYVNRERKHGNVWEECGWIKGRSSWQEIIEMIQRKGRGKKMVEKSGGMEGTEGELVRINKKK